MKMQNMRVPLDSMISESEMLSDLEECEEKCRVDCDCTAFAFVNIGVGHCVNWIGELNRLRNYNAGGYDLYIKVAAKDPG